MAAPSRLRIAIIGGGASGALMAAHLLRRDPRGIAVTIVERRADLGRGLAYATDNPGHLLNVRAANMSGFADDPDHFWRWLVAQGEVAPDADRFRFVSRGLYGRYLGALACGDALTVLRDTAVAATSTPPGVTISLESGGAVAADVAILACGHETPADEGPLTLSPWTTPVGGGAPEDSTILVLGAGLTMVDAATALAGQGHRGRIVALSRRGLTPHAHRRVEPLPIDPETAPFGADLATLCHWLRERARAQAAAGGDWRSVIDGLRPHTQTLWRRMAARDRRRFLEHARPWWDVHRHRMAPETAARLGALIEAGQLEIVAGRLVAVAEHRDGARVSFRRRHAEAVESLVVSRILSCKGVTSAAAAASPLVASLFAQGLARMDDLGVGLDVSVDCALVARDGRPSSRLFAIGPMSQAAFWEITAVPDIRLQTAALAARLAPAGAG